MHPEPQIAVITHPSGSELPALIAAAGDRAAWRFLEFFTVNIRNKNTRAAIRKPLVQGSRSAPTVKQHLACIRMPFDWLVAGQVIATNPAHAVRGPRHSIIKGATAVMSSQEATAFLNSMDASQQMVGLPDRAFIGVMVYAFARVSAVVGLKVKDYSPLKKRCWLRLHEKGGKVNEMGCHDKLEQFLDAYIEAAGIADNKKGPLFPAAIGRTGKLSDRPMSRVDAWYMVQRRFKDAGLETAIGNHSFRAIGITDYLENGGDINIAKRMAGHSNIKTTELTTGAAMR